MPSVRVLAGAVMLSLLSACASRPSYFPEPLRAPKSSDRAVETLQEEALAQRKRPLVELGPHSPEQSSKPAVAAEVAPLIPKLIPRKQMVSIVLEGVSIESFINVVFGMELGFGVQIDPALITRPELLSLNLTEPQAPGKVYAIAQEVLKSYDIKVTELGGVLRFQSAQQVSGSAALPSIVAARSLPDVPAGQRSVFVAMPLAVAQPGAVAAQVRNLFGSHSVTISEMIEANALMISGPGDAVRAAMSAVQTLDRGGVLGKRSLRINPLYVPVELLTKELGDVLTAQGISVKTGPGTSGVISFVPVTSANALLIFSESEVALQAAQEWVAKLDQPMDESGGGGLYLYAARHTTVETLVPVLEALVGGGASSSSSSANHSADRTTTNGLSGSIPAKTAAVSSISGDKGQLAIDPVRNVIVFQGEAQRWRAIQGVLARLDQPARQVVIEVTIAEVTLTNEFSHGVEWALRNVSVEGMKGPLTALAGAAGGGGGLVWQGVSSSGQVRALLNLFAKDSRVSIISTPRILVKSGESASIDVGTEVPIITSQATAADLPSSGNNSSILQSVQYRKTGVLMDIEAVVHSGQRVDLKVSQEVSEATPTDSSDISSPSIFSRKLRTSLSLADGESTLLGGLISNTRSTGKTKVPLLGDIPLLGAAFQSKSQTGTRTELLMLITPYVVEDAAQTRAITEAIRSRFGNAGAEYRQSGSADPSPKLPDSLSELADEADPAVEPEPAARPRGVAESAEVN
jgi:general secretion pathway protein D